MFSSNSMVCLPVLYGYLSGTFEVVWPLATWAFFSAPTYDLSVQYFYEECVRLRQDKERLIALLHTLRWVQCFIAHICHCKYSQYTLYGAYRDYNSRKLDQLSEQIVTLTSSFAEFSKSVSSALEDINPMVQTPTPFSHIQNCFPVSTALDSSPSHTGTGAPGPKLGTARLPSIPRTQSWSYSARTRTDTSA